MSSRRGHPGEVIQERSSRRGHPGEVIQERSSRRGHPSKITHTELVFCFYFVSQVT
jgi:hypothetical protein